MKIRHGFRIALLGFFLFLFSFAQASLPRTTSASDSIDVVHYDIHLDTLQVGLQSIEAWTRVRFTPVVNGINQATLDLLMLTVDSITYGPAATPLSWTYNDTLLRINLLTTHNIGDTAELTVYYHGQPRRDPSTFGGFYMTAAYVYNIGVGFQSDPHNFGRVWFPCKDNFTDKATYTVSARVLNGQRAVSGGTLQSEIPNGDGTTTFIWTLRDPIPSYLASIAVADYVEIRDTFYSINGDSIPVSNFVLATDSLDLIASFSNLNDAFNTMENQFGAYSWERVGYVGVPFNAGAMEHATNIAWPLFAVTGNLLWETTMAHELSHSWFGNLATCETAEDMWLNEGFASFCEATFTEALYGYTAYQDYNRANLSEVLRYAHYADGGHRAVSGIPHNYTYGRTVYNKGALVAHTLRNYIGDSLFFAGMRFYLSSHSFANANSDDLRQDLESISGQNLSGFFDGWVYAGGFPHFSVDSFSVTPNGPNFDVEVFVRQRLREAPAFFNDNQIPLRFGDNNWQFADSEINFNGQLGSAIFTLPFAPDFVMIDPEQTIADATVDTWQTVNSTGLKPFSNGYCSLNVTNLNPGDSAFVRVTHNWIGPDDFKIFQPGIRLSNTRHWKVEGIFPPGFISTASFNYSSQLSATNPLGFLDNNWFTGSEDSIVFFYRSGPESDWEMPSYTLVTGNLIDKKGTVLLDTLKPGEYTFGRMDYTIVGLDEFEGLGENSLQEGGQGEPFTVWPNPVDRQLEISVRNTETNPNPTRNTHETFKLELYNARGSLMDNRMVSFINEMTKYTLPELPEGVYLIRLTNTEGKSSSVRIIHQIK